MLDSIALMNGMTEKMNFLQTRQRVLSQNISNADSPGYQAMDVKAPDFKGTLGRYMNKNSVTPLSLATPTAGQVSHLQMLNRAEKGEQNRQPYEVAPVKNSVSLEEQMMNASTTAVDYQLMTNVYNKNIDMLHAAMKSN